MGFSWWPPNSWRIADSALSANSSRWREANREYNADVDAVAVILGIFQRRGFGVAVLGAGADVGVVHDVEWS
ncbi:MAG TPA: hypothetical protein VF003_02980, partial [Pseudonocardiaceae bacterium]